MIESPVTRASLLLRLGRDNDPEAWQQFLSIYAPVIYGFARKRGLQDADAADLMQEVLRSVAASAGRLNYDPKRGTFRGWLFTVTRNKIYSHFDGKRRHVQASGDSAARERLDQLSAADASEEALEKEYQKRLAALALERIRGEFQRATWDAFQGTAVEGRDAKAVGAELGMSPGAVYVAKSRVLARLKQEVSKLQEE